MRKLSLAWLVLILFPLIALADGDVGATPIYAASFTAPDGRVEALERLKGKVAVVNFWATWCPPCRREIPDLVAAHASFKARGVEFVGIAVEDNPQGVGEFAHAYGIEYPLLLGKEKGIAIMQALGNTAAGLPYTVVLDAAGRIVASRRGQMKPEQMEKALQAALAGGE